MEPERLAEFLERFASRSCRGSDLVVDDLLDHNVAPGEGHRGGRTHAELMLAEVHVRAGEPRGLMPARQAIDAVSTLQSVAARRERLAPLITALEARPGSDAKEIARIAHRIAATRM